MTLPPRHQYGEGTIEINAGRRTVKVTVRNTGDRAIQVGSDYHFFEANSALEFDRNATLGTHLNIAAGTSVRFEPGGTREVELCAYAGTGRLTGFSGLLNGSVKSHPARVEAVARAFQRGFRGAEGPAGSAAGNSPSAGKSSAGKAEGKGDSAKSGAKKAKKKGTN
ncbi:MULTISPECIES: urease subunit beta [unclassified Streptomyces]|uniref:urease subunit beta n=1 Tax=unclassified Streptomyces TaxID=2593676 RepID=UPI0022388C18|nr:urease subunit beta [Streptomyces sp. SHP 1-2]MCW5253916.1 urease subunit beta [Streptomyces sp. SHP 1-2]